MCDLTKLYFDKVIYIYIYSVDLYECNVNMDHWWNVMTGKLKYSEKILSDYNFAHLNIYICTFHEQTLLSFSSEFIVSSCRFTKH